MIAAAVQQTRRVSVTEEAEYAVRMLREMGYHDALVIEEQGDAYEYLGLDRCPTAERRLRKEQLCERCQRENSEYKIPAQPCLVVHVPSVLVVVPAPRWPVGPAVGLPPAPREMVESILHI